MRCGALVLAAGIARRFGSDKRQWRMADGRTLLETTLQRYQDAFRRVVLVMRPEDEDAGWSQGLPECEKVYARNARFGMGHSLASGAAILGDLDAAFIALGDMPWVRVSTLRALREAMGNPEAIVRPAHRGVPGHPVGFGRAYFPELRKLTGDSGAKTLLRRHAAQLTTLAVADPGVLQDFDIPPATADGPIGS